MSDDETALRRENDRMRRERRALRETRLGRLLERDRQWEAAMRAAGCAVERVTLLDDGTIVKWRGGGGCAWGVA